MSTTSPALPPNPSLIAILLVIRTRAGQPRLVFHYPLTPSLSSTTQAAPPARPSWHGGASAGADGEESSTEHSSDSDDDDQSPAASPNGSAAADEEKRSKTGSWKSKRDDSKHTPASARLLSGRRDIDHELETGSGDDDEDGLSSQSHGMGRLNGDADGAWRPEWERVLGFDANALSKLLTPGPAFIKKRFEIGIDNLVFQGAPVCVNGDGTWRRQKKPKIKLKKHASRRQERSAEKNSGNGNGSSGIDDFKLDDRTQMELVSGFEAAYGHGLDDAAYALPSGAASDVASINEPENCLTMFHVILVMNPPALEHHVRVNEMYDHVTRKLAKYLKHEQARRNLVWDESVKILSLKEKGKENCSPAYILWPSIVGASPLAKALVHVFDSISKSKIAHVNLDKSYDKVFQIPQPEFTPFVSKVREPQVPGLRLTTTPFAGDEHAHSILNPNSALLLLEDRETLIKEIEKENKELTGPLTWFINNLTPTKSLQKQFNNPYMALLFKDSLFLAHHLIYWRRARAIPPLSPKDTYIVSPNADMSALPTAMSAFAARFPMLPPLPGIIHRLSERPRPYLYMMPSKDHRPAYMEILAWLMRGGWVTQLKSFGWVSVPAKVKQEVAEKMAEEAKNRSRSDRHSGVAENASSTSMDPSPASSSAPSPYLSAYSTSSRPSSDAGSATSERTIMPHGAMSASPPHNQSIPTKPSPLHVESLPLSETDKAKASPSLASTRSIGSLRGNDVLDTDDAFSPSIIQSPQKANALQSRWIEHIGSSFADPRLTEYWPIMLDYLDGSHALDDIALREGLNRSLVADMVGKLSAGGWILTVRHC